MTIPDEFSKYGVSNREYPYPQYRAVPITETCWYCEHAQHADQGKETDFPRAIECRFSTADHWEGDKFQFPFHEDGTWHWCSNWRKSTLEVPDIPEWEPKPPTPDQ